MRCSVFDGEADCETKESPSSPRSCRAVAGQPSWLNLQGPMSRWAVSLGQSALIRAAPTSSAWYHVWLVDEGDLSSSLMPSPAYCKVEDSPPTGGPGDGLGPPGNPA